MIRFPFVDPLSHKGERGIAQNFPSTLLIKVKNMPFKSAYNEKEIKTAFMLNTPYSWLKEPAANRDSFKTFLTTK